MTDDPAMVELERERLALERERLEMDRAKFESDRALAEQRLGEERFGRRATTLGIGIPVLVAAIALLANLLVANANAASEFRLKAAELSLSDAIGPSTIRQRAQALRDLFPERLPQDFADDITGGQFLLGTPDEFRLRVLQDAVVKAQCAEQVVGLWRDILGPGKGRDEGKLEWLADLDIDPCPAEPAAQQTE